ncbi:hypothetical protein QTI66_31470 [Variovorax sp. J22R133]|uniref:hypothetical protein n=1 Tax=Variovorax brevis TaxID=3053503 RepID=UPI002578A636|nr:hypothetical protein [Variovorax sp. J22R133]MDM0116662.1 hypothetical protein [Variovorax sp. J22R133]
MLVLAVPSAPMMDVSMVGGLAGVVGSLAGSTATIAIAWITQKTHGRRELVRMEIGKHEALYGEFIAECGKLLMDALTHTLDQPETLVPAYALLNRIRLTASAEVLAEAERLLRRIADQYFASNLTAEDVSRIAHSQDADPLKVFGEACRRELKAIRAGL